MLTANHFRGTVPSYTHLTELYKLFLGQNRLNGESLAAYLPKRVVAGTIPSFAANSKLERLDLSFNQLTGPVPDSFVSPLTFSRYDLDLSHNLLSGMSLLQLPHICYFA